MEETVIVRPPAPLKLRRRWPIRIGYIVGACALCVLGLYLYQRVVRGNFGTVVPGKVYRSAQPKPQQIKDWVRQYGIKTVINLRGERNLEYDDEVKAAAEAGAHVEVVKLSATRHPSTAHMHELVKAMDSPQPILFHCKEGADRAGVASVMAAMAIGGKSYDDAKNELTIIHFHVDTSKGSIAGVLNEYEDFCAARGQPRGGWEEFSHWAMHDYCNGFYLIEIDVPRTMNIAGGQAVDIDVAIKNISPQTIPCGQNPGKFLLVAFGNLSKEGFPDNQYAGMPLPGPDLQPGQTVKFKMPIGKINASGTRSVMFDVWDEHDHPTWFCAEGSHIAKTELNIDAPELTTSAAGATK
jgi:protein tyrosine phosphatase (PTP) superfamily phosphohydrolase (DUF442 family)